MMINNESLLRQAMDKRLVVRFKYKNELYYREAKPHTIFEANTNNILVYSLQTKDESKPFQGEVPREYEIGLMKDLSTTNIKFQPQLGYTPNKLKARRIIHTL